MERSYGGSPDARRKLALDVAEGVRAVWPAYKPFFRPSCVGGIDGGLEVEDSVILSRELGQRGVDVVFCSSAGIRSVTSNASGVAPKPWFQVPYAARIRLEAGLVTMAVGLPPAARAEDVLVRGDADIVALGRAALQYPNWALRAGQELVLDPDRAC